MDFYSFDLGDEHEQQNSTRPKTIRCAIYTRKSTEEGLDQQFNSLDAQREAAEAYIRSQKCEGWEIVYDRYDDGGFSVAISNGQRSSD